MPPRRKKPRVRPVKRKKPSMFEPPGVLDRQQAGSPAPGLPSREEMNQWQREDRQRRGEPVPSATPGPAVAPTPVPTPEPPLYATPGAPPVTWPEPEPKRSQPPLPPIPTVNPMNLPVDHPFRSQWRQDQRTQWLADQLRDLPMPWQSVPTAPSNYRPAYRWFDPRYLRPHEPQFWQPPAWDIPDYGVVEV